MKTNKTFEQALAIYKGDWPGTGIDTASARIGWAMCETSVVDEPVLTETQIRNVTLHTLDLLDWANNATTQGNAADFITKALLAAGHIPASKPHLMPDLEDLQDANSAAPTEIRSTGYMTLSPTPQQEGGLTREWLMGFRVFGSALSGQDADAILLRHTQALEAKEAEVKEARMERNHVANELTAYKVMVHDLTQQLAEAKKGRYAIDWSKAKPHHVGAVIEFTADDEVRASRTLWHAGYIQRPQATTPTIEQMKREWKEKYRGMDYLGTREHSAEEAANALSDALIESKGDMTALWRRDCKGGMK